MAETLIYALGGVCVAHSAAALALLGQRAARRPTARDARTGRPLNIRLDRRNGSRRSADRSR